MEPKKSEKADVNSRSGIYRDLGIFAAVVMVIMAFSYKKYTKIEFTLQSNIAFEDEEDIADITKEEEKTPPPPPPPVIQVVEDDVEVEETQPEFEEVDVPEDFEVDIPEPIQETGKVDEPVFTVVEKMPHFPGKVEEAEQKMMEYVMSRIVYPEMEKQNNIEGMVIVQFIVGTNGDISGVTYAPGTESRGTQAMRDEAIKVVETMPRWVPGEQRGKPVKVKFTLPIRFKLR